MFEGAPTAAFARTGHRPNSEDNPLFGQEPAHGRDPKAGHPPLGALCLVPLPIHLHLGVRLLCLAASEQSCPRARGTEGV